MLGAVRRQSVQFCKHLRNANAYPGCVGPSSDGIGGFRVAVPLLNDLVNLAEKYPTILPFVWFWLGHKTKPLAASRTLFGWAGEFVDMFYGFKARCAESRKRHAIPK
jgi:hypothetical protein